MLGFLPIASGSKGNCLYIGGPQTRLLIDAGISGTLILKRLQELAIDPHSIDAILVTHEHSDHIKGLCLVAKKLNIPVFANAETALGIYRALGEKPKFKIFATGETFHYKEFKVHPFSVPHDTLDPVGFTFEIESLKVGVCADLGHFTTLIQKQLEACDYLYLEANHEPSMVHASNRPSSLKKRILGKQGHLSNAECAELLKRLLHPKLKHVYLAHLSSECNQEEVALNTVKRALEGLHVSCELSIAFQDRPSKKSVFDQILLK